MKKRNKHHSNCKTLLHHYLLGYYMIIWNSESESDLNLIWTGRPFWLSDLNLIWRFFHNRGITMVNVLVRSMFEVSKGMLLADTICVSAWSMFRCSRYVIARNFFISGRNLTYDSSKSLSWWALSCWSIKFDLW